MNIFSIIRKWFFKKKELISDDTIISCHNNVVLYENPQNPITSIVPPMRQVTKGWFTMREESKTMDELKVSESKDSGQPTHLVTERVQRGGDHLASIRPARAPVKPKIDFNELKFCKDCKYFALDSISKDLSFGRCHHRKAIKLNDTVYSEYSQFLVSGNPTGTEVEYYLCSTMRHVEYGECGEEAKFFEPKEKIT